MSPKLKAYLTAVFAVALLVLAATLPQDLKVHGLHYLAWIVIGMLSQYLCLPAMSGTGTVTMASSAGLAAILLWGIGPACWIAALNTLLAEWLMLKKPIIRATFNAGQITLTTWAAGFGFAIGVVSTHFGVSARGGSTAVGRAVHAQVVACALAIFATDYLATVWLG